MRVFLTVLAVWSAGLGAATQFGKMSILFDALGQRYAGSSAVALGLIVSVVGIVGLVFGTTAGLFVERLGQRRVMVTALLAGAAMSVLQTLDLSYLAIIFSRVVEGMSHLAIVVVGPTVMASVANDRFRGAVMTLWSSFFGVAYSLLALFAPWDVTMLFLSHAAWLALCAAALAILMPPDRRSLPTAEQKGSILSQHAVIYRSPRLAAPAMGFLFYTFLYVALLTLLPPQIPDDYRAVAASGMPAMSIVVSLTLGVWLLTRLSPVRLVQLGYAAAIPAFALLALVWGDGALMTVSALWLSSALGLVQGASFASIPFLNGSGDTRAKAAGAIAQLGNLGTTTGTPVIAAILVGAGPWGLALCAIVACLLGMALHQVQHVRRQTRST